MAASEYHIDTVSGDDGTGDGSSGSPWATLQHALDTVTRNSTDGDIFWISGTDTQPAGGYDLSTYGARTEEAPIWLRGYGSTPGDRTRATIDLDFIRFMGSNQSYVHQSDIDYVNLYVGTSAMLRQDYSTVERCSFTASVGTRGIRDAGTESSIRHCQVYDFNGASFQDEVFEMGGNGHCEHNYIEVEEGTAIAMNTGTCNHNIVVVKGSSSARGIAVSRPCLVTNNTVVSLDGSSGLGIAATSTHLDSAVIENNYIEGFSGSGGTGIDLAQTGHCNMSIESNAVFDCDTEYDFANTKEEITTTPNLTLLSTGIAHSGVVSFANRFTYFAAVDEDDMLDAAPQGANAYIGAVGPVPGGGGSPAETRYNAFKQQVIG